MTPSPRSSCSRTCYIGAIGRRCVPDLAEVLASPMQVYDERLYTQNKSGLYHRHFGRTLLSGLIVSMLRDRFVKHALNSQQFIR